MTQTLRILFVVDGYTDIRFVTGLSEICRLTMVVPSRAYIQSGLSQRVALHCPGVEVCEIPGNRLEFQLRSLAKIIRHASTSDIILAQEVTRGALNANAAGILMGVPVLNTIAMPPIEYYRCRRYRGLIWRGKYYIGETAIRGFLAVNGLLSTGWLALGSYLEGVAKRSTSRVGRWGYYGVDTSRFGPASDEERSAIRQRLGLDPGQFIVLNASRVSHEKDPETALKAVAIARRRGLNAAILNLGGGFQDFVALAGRLGWSDVDQWVYGRPAADPMGELCDYFRAADVVVQSSLEEGLGLSPLESLACGTPVVATSVGGMAAHLGPWAELVPRQNCEATATAIEKIASDPASARAKALQARENYIVPEWDRNVVFRRLKDVLEQVSRTGAVPRAK